MIRSVAAEQPTINRLAELLDVTKQAASQLADEAEGAGFVERFADPSDRRRRRLRLTAQGRAGPRDRARSEVPSSSGSSPPKSAQEAVDACRAALIALVTRNGALEDVLARRARLVR